MYINDKKRIVALLNTVIEALDYCIDGGDEWKEYVKLSAEALESISLFIASKDTEVSIKIVQKDFERLYNIDASSVMSKSIANIIKQIKNDIEYQIGIINRIESKWRAVFLPYKVSMWTSLESIWQAAYDDPSCDALVIPIPYYDIGSSNDITLKYEGDKFQDYIPITPYDKYNIEVENPEMIFIHNPYDDANNLTRVPEIFYSSTLKENTGCLVYSPYFTYAAYNPGRTDFQYAVPGARNADFIIVQSERVKDIFRSYGHPESKLLAVGSPKIDAVVAKMKQPINIPIEWEIKLKDRKVFLLNTHLSYFPQSSTNTTKSGDYAVRYYNEILKAIINKPGCALIWRPHPLLETMLKERFPKCFLYIKEISRIIEESDNCVIDRTGDYSLAFTLSDALISTYSSLINEYMVTGKPVMIFQRKASEEEIERAPINRNLNYFRFKPDGMTFDDFIDMICNEKDPLKEKRMEMISKAFLNIDGTAGKKAYEVLSRKPQN